MPYKAKSPYSVLGVVPEKQMLAREMNASFPAYYSGQSTSTSMSIDGVASSPAGEPMLLPLTATSGVSRVQFLVASQALGVPFFPNYCKEQGGVVVDRVIAKAGGEDWWTAMSGRVRVQNLLAAYQDSCLGLELKNPSNYSLCSNTKISLGRTTTFRLKAELDGKGLSTRGGSESNMHAVSGHANMRKRLAGGAIDVNAELGINVRQVTAGGAQPTRTNPAAPIQSSVDIGTSSSQPLPLQYRVGIHQVSHTDVTGTMKPTVYVQAGMALQGERTLWSAGRATGAEIKSPIASSKRVSSNPIGGSTPPSAHPGTSLTPPLAASTTHPAKTNEAIGPHNPLRQTLRALGAFATHSNTAVTEGNVNSPSGVGWKRRGEISHIVHPDQVQELLLDGTQSINRLREDLQGITEWVESGALVERLGGVGAGSKTRQIKGHVSKMDGSKANAEKDKMASRWSAVLPTAHLKIGGMVGSVARVPLTTFRNQTAQGTQAANVSASLPSLSLDRSGFERVSQMFMGSVEWLKNGPGQRLAADGASVRPFASGGMLLQFGSFQRNFLDFTRVMVKSDIRLSSTHDIIESCKGRMPQLSTRGAYWHALTLSCSQQIIGPVRFCADLRFQVHSTLTPTTPTADSAADSPHVVESASMGGLDTMKRVARRIGSIRPSLLDATYGLDVAVPGASGLARLVAWYAPGRREGMLELRLF